jgi:mono/diheme cytochrome c family protein
MNRNAAVALGAAALVAAVSIPLVAGQGPANPYPPPKPQAMATTPAARGAQLVSLGGCHDCHTPKLPNGAPDMSRALSGHPENAPLAPNVIGGVSTNMMLTAWRGPWGVSLTRNLTPDKATGLGDWTLADFKKTIRTGVSKRGDVLMPPMPIPGLQNLPDQDLDNIYAYLRTLTPVRNAVGRAAPPQK